MQRLRTRPQFQAALKGAIVARTPHFVLHAWGCTDDFGASDAGRTEMSAQDDPRAVFDGPFPPSGILLGAMVPKRWARRAVTRNAIRRQIYAVAAAYEDRMASAAYVVRLRSTFDRQRFVSATSEPLRRAVRAELEQLFAQAARRCPTGAGQVRKMTEAAP